MNRRSRRRRPLRFAAALAACAVAGCASARAYPEASYAYDDDARRGSYAPGAPAEPAPDAMYEAQATVASRADAPSLFDAIGGLVAGGGAEGAERAEAPPPPPKPAPPVPPGPTEAPTTADAPTQQKTKRLVIYRASYALLVSNVEESVEKFLKAVVDEGGYLESRSGDVVAVRVPAASFQGLVDKLPTYGRVTSQNVSAQDVTKQFLDTTIRLENAEASRKRLLELLKQATKMEDILAIEREVRRLSEEIEAMKGELRFLSDQIAFSTITVQFQSNAPPPVAWPQQRRSRFEWVNQVGLERVIHDF